MPTLYGRRWTRAELLASVGDMAQVAGIRESRLVGGRADGVRALDFNCGDGFRFTVLPDRCMDIPFAEYGGAPLAWVSRAGISGPQYHDPAGEGWLRTFFGGLLTTCGLRQVGAPCVDEGETLGMHGRISTTPAEEVAYEARWEGDEYILQARGTMREGVLYGEDLRLSREITTRAGARSLLVRDRVENRGMNSSPLMILYHVNAGFPLLGPDSRLLVASRDLQAKDERSAQTTHEHRRFGPPTPEWREVNWAHDVQPDENGYCVAAIVNEGLSFPFGRALGLALRWRGDQLNTLNQWKQIGHGDYTVGIEPANCHTLGRAWERENGELQYIEPGETRNFEVEISALVGADEIDEFESRLPEIAT
ncbi:MAG TPA: aldose 1-epimerase family protein [Ktedonobacterales bacterium]|jgi:Domain of unknown function (DUF4432)|nr:aldose 1-epimerase family protein [Ktedonobacterales bacterium]